MSDIDYDIMIGGYHDHTPISGHPILVPDINPDIRYVVYDIGDMMTPGRYRAGCVPDILVVTPPAATRRYRVTSDMSRYRVERKPRYRDT